MRLLELVILPIIVKKLGEWGGRLLKHERLLELVW